MANQRNFRTNLRLTAQSFTKYTVSRVVENLADELLEAEFPPSLTQPDNINNIRVEVSAYSLFDNSLAYSTTIRNTAESTPIFTKTFSYVDGTSRTMLYIDFTKISSPLSLPIGRYQAVFNVFLDAIGSSEDRVLRVKRISLSRKEVELEHTNPTPQNLRTLAEYVEPSFNASVVVTAIQQIFDLVGASALSIPASNVGITTSSVLVKLDSGSLLETYGFVEDAEDQPGINTITRGILDRAYTFAQATASQDISKGTSSFSANKLYGYVTESIRRAYDEVILDAQTNPTKYRFNLI